MYNIAYAKKPNDEKIFIVIRINKIGAITNFIITRKLSRCFLYP